MLELKLSHAPKHALKKYPTKPHACERPRRPLSDFLKTEVLDHLFNKGIITEPEFAKQPTELFPLP